MRVSYLFLCCRFLAIHYAITLYSNTEFLTYSYVDSPYIAALSTTIQKKMNPIFASLNQAEELSNILIHRRKCSCCNQGPQGPRGLV